VGLLLALPGLLATVALSHWIVEIFFSREFLAAIDLISWFMLGCLGRVISWPLGYVMLAMGRKYLYLLTETFAHLVHVFLIVFAHKFWGIEGVAIAFFLLYIFYSILVVSVGKLLTNFQWSARALKLITIAVGLSFSMFLVDRFFGGLLGGVMEVSILALAGIISGVGLFNSAGANAILIEKLMRNPILRSLIRSVKGP
jgi:antigen flippase